MSGIHMALLGSAGTRVNFVNQTILAARSGSPASALYKIDNDGFDYKNVNGTLTSLTNWVIPASAGSDYEVFATLVTGGLSSGTTGSWVATSSDPSWSCIAAIVGTSVFATLDFQVRAIGTSTVLDTWTVNLDAERI